MKRYPFSIFANDLEQAVGVVADNSLHTHIDDAAHLFFLVNGPGHDFHAIGVGAVHHVLVHDRPCGTEPFGHEVQPTHDLLIGAAAASNQIRQVVAGIALVDVIEGTGVEGLYDESVAEIQRVECCYADVYELVVFRPVAAFDASVMVGVALDFNVVVHG